jgi:hypothetical protein
MIQPDPEKLFEAEFNRLVFNKLQDSHFSKDSTLKKSVGVKSNRDYNISLGHHRYYMEST